jgi:hypothetical protein
MVKNLKTYIDVLYYVGYIMAKAIEPVVNIGVDTNQNKAVLEGKKLLMLRLWSKSAG